MMFIFFFKSNYLLIFSKEVSMSNIIYQYGNWQVENSSRIQSISIFTQRVFNFIKNKNGWQLFNDLKAFNF